MRRDEDRKMGREGQERELDGERAIGPVSVVCCGSLAANWVRDFQRQQGRELDGEPMNATQGVR